MPERLSRRLADLEGAESALVVASGAAANACALLALLRTGDHLLASVWLRPETRRFCERALPALGVTVSFVDPREMRGWRRAVTRTTRALFVESPVQASTRLVDFKPPRTLASELGIALIADTTAASPANFRPLQHGADVVVHDGQPFLAASCDGGVGVVCGTESLIDEVRAVRDLLGVAPHPAALDALARGLETLDVRAARQNDNAREVADWAQHSPAVMAVHYPGLASHPEHALASELLRGFGSTVVLELHDPAVAERICDVTDDVAGASLASVIRPGDSPGTVRVQVGVEAPQAVLDWLSTRLP